MTELKFKIYYSQSLFFLVDSFSCWSIHTRQYMKKKLPELYSKVKKYLPAYAKLRRKKYGWNALEIYFLTPSLKKAKENIKKNLPTKDAKIILKPIELLNPHFKPYFKKNLPLANAQIILINQLWKEFGNQAIKEIEKFFSIKVPDKMNIYVRLNLYGAGGGANLDRKGLDLELGMAKRHPLGGLDTLIHEIIHYAEKIHNRSGSRELGKLGLNDKGDTSDASATNEAILGLLTPHGFLSKRIGLVRTIMPLGKPRNAYERKKIAFMKKIRSLALRRFNNPKGDYVKDFLPKVAKRLKSQ